MVPGTFFEWIEGAERLRPPRLITRLIAALGDESAQDLVEYALVAALIALGTVASTHDLARTIGGALGRVGTSLSGAV